VGPVTTQNSREWAEQLAATVDPGRLVGRLVDAGWVEEGRRTDVYVRLRWPGSAGSLVVPLDRAAPEHVPLMAAALMELEWAVERGRAAWTVLDGLTPPGR
jgi:hypothetical protein